MLALAVSEGREVASCTVDSEMDVLGINDRLQQQQVEREYQQREARRLLQSGVAIADAQRIDIRGQLVCGAARNWICRQAWRGRTGPDDGLCR